MIAEQLSSASLRHYHRHRFAVSTIEALAGFVAVRGAREKNEARSQPAIVELNVCPEKQSYDYSLLRLILRKSI